MQYALLMQMAGKPPWCLEVYTLCDDIEELERQTALLRKDGAEFGVYARLEEDYPASQATAIRSEDEIKAKFDELVLQRDKCKKGSAGRRILNDNVRALAWVLHHPGVPELGFDEQTRELLNDLK